MSYEEEEWEHVALYKTMLLWSQNQTQIGWHGTGTAGLLSCHMSNGIRNDGLLFFLSSTHSV